jgi:hypothetical protein
MAYYYINGFNFDESKIRIVKLVGYMTDSNHNNFLPPRDFSREQVIEWSKKGDIFFIEDGCYRIIKIKLHCCENEIFLRIDNHSAPFDYFG